MFSKVNTRFKLVLIVLLPFIIGYFINWIAGLGVTRNNQLYFKISDILLSLWTYTGIVFWFYAGRIFGNLDMKPIKSYILGNIAWGISISLYTWQFILLDSTSRNLLLAGISQHYVLGFVRWGSRILTIFTNHIKVTTVILIAYLLMLLIFSLGFVSVVHSKSAK